MPKSEYNELIKPTNVNKIANILKGLTIQLPISKIIEIDLAIICNIFPKTNVENLNISLNGKINIFKSIIIKPFLQYCLLKATSNIVIFIASFK